MEYPNSNSSAPYTEHQRADDNSITPPHLNAAVEGYVSTDRLISLDFIPVGPPSSPVIHLVSESQQVATPSTLTPVLSHPLIDFSVLERYVQNFRVVYSTSHLSSFLIH